MGNHVRIKERREDYDPPAFAFPLLYVSGLAFVVWMASIAVLHADAKHAAAACLIAALFASTTPLLWKLGDKLRLYAMPTGYSVRTFGDLVWTKLFWTIGPQSAPMLLYCFAALIAAFSGRS